MSLSRLEQQISQYDEEEARLLEELESEREVRLKELEEEFARREEEIDRIYEERVQEEIIRAVKGDAEALLRRSVEYAHIVRCEGTKIGLEITDDPVDPDMLSRIQEQVSTLEQEISAQKYQEVVSACEKRITGINKDASPAEKASALPLLIRGAYLQAAKVLEQYRSSSLELQELLSRRDLQRTLRAKERIEKNPVEIGAVIHRGSGNKEYLILPRTRSDETDLEREEKYIRDIFGVAILQALHEYVMNDLKLEATAPKNSIRSATVKSLDIHFNEGLEEEFPCDYFELNDIGLSSEGYRMKFYAALEKRVHELIAASPLAAANVQFRGFDSTTELDEEYFTDEYHTVNIAHEEQSEEITSVPEGYISIQSAAEAVFELSTSERGYKQKIKTACEILERKVEKITKPNIFRNHPTDVGTVVVDGVRYFEEEGFHRYRAECVLKADDDSWIFEDSKIFCIDGSEENDTLLQRAFSESVKYIKGLITKGRIQTLNAMYGNLGEDKIYATYDQILLGITLAKTAGGFA